MTEPHPEIIIVKRHGAHEEEHHGGAWKIAFADFMTAMMAFFLVLWIISATDKNTKTLIARYFNPVKVEEPAKAQKGIHGVPEKDAYAPGADTAAPSGGKPDSERGDAQGDKADEGAAAGSSNRRRRRSPIACRRRRIRRSPIRQCRSRNCSAILAPASTRSPARRRPGLASILRRRSRAMAKWGPSADEALRDPFRPLGSDQAVNVVAHDPGAPPAAAAPSDEPVSMSTSIAPAAGSPTGSAEAQAPPRAAPAPPKLKARDRPRRRRRIRRRPTPPRRVRSAASNLLADLKKRLAGEAKAMQGPQLDVQATEEGILISLTDRQNFSMFAIGSAEPQPRVVQDDGRDRREPAEASRARSSCADTPTRAPTGPRPTTIGGSPRRARRWPITC